MMPGHALAGPSQPDMSVVATIQTEPVPVPP
jgi:hypothetical protein